MIPLYGTSYTTCIGCDTSFNEMLNIRENCIRQTGRANHIAHSNTMNTASFTSTSSGTSQSQNTQRQQSASSSSTSNTRSVRANNNVAAIGTFGTSGERAQNYSSNVSQPNRQNSVNRSAAAANNRGNADPWITNWNDFNSSDTRSDQATSSSRNTNGRNNTWGNIDNNTEIMCNCHETAIQLTVRKEGPNKGKLLDTYFDRIINNFLLLFFFLLLKKKKLICLFEIRDYLWFNLMNLYDLSRKLLQTKCMFAGRLFYKCAKPQGSGCDFFLWASDNAESVAASGHSNWISTDRNDSGSGSAGHFSRNVGTSNNDWGNTNDDVMCHCNQLARKWVWSMITSTNCSLNNNN